MNTARLEASYHDRLREEKRASAMRAAMALFLEQGYERTSLQQVAKRADLSTSTLFKHFPTKTVLFEAIVEEFWALEETCEHTALSGPPSQILRKIGLGFAERMRRAEMQALFRLIIAETALFPDLGKRLYDKGIGPYFIRLDKYLAQANDLGFLTITDIPAASRQFLAMIAGQVLWPELLVPGCGGTDDQAIKVVEDAVTTMLARHGVNGASKAPHVSSPATRDV